MERDALIKLLATQTKSGDEIGILDNQVIYSDLKIEPDVFATKVQHSCRFPSKRAKTKIIVLMAASKVVVY